MFIKTFPYYVDNKLNLSSSTFTLKNIDAVTDPLTLNVISWGQLGEQLSLEWTGCHFGTIHPVPSMLEARTFLLCKTTEPPHVLPLTKTKIAFCLWSYQRQSSSIPLYFHQLNFFSAHSLVSLGALCLSCVQGWMMNGNRAGIQRE